MVRAAHSLLTNATVFLLAVTMVVIAVVTTAVSPERAEAQTQDYDRATWYGAASGNYTDAGRGPVEIDRVVIHTTQGSWAHSIYQSTQPGTGESVHYTVRSSDGFIAQSVREEDIAHHAGDWTINQRSIGIEHEGYTSESGWFTDAMYRSSARLTASVVRKYRIPIDREHIIGHNEVPNQTHTDPGKYWDWQKYMGYVKYYANPPYQQVVDDSGPRFTSSTVWKHKSFSSQKYGSSYRLRKPGGDDPAAYKVRIPAKDKYAVYARWPASSGYNSATRYQIRTAGGWVTKTRDQRRNGGRWVSLGAYMMPAGDRVHVRVSSRSSATGYIVADAVRIVRR